MEQPTLPPGLSPEQTQTGSLLRQLLGNAIANRYLDFCKLANGAILLHATRPLAGHALRELESLLRQVLAAPLDAVAPDDPDEKRRRQKALKALKVEFDYDEESLQRAQKALRPSLSHRKQILRIVDRLGFAPDADITKAWIALSKTVGQVHRRKFDRSLEVDDEFREEFMRPFDAVIGELAVALQTRYGDLIRRAGQIAAMPPARGVVAFVDEIPGAPQLQHHFYERIASEDWLPALQKRGLLGEPLFGPEENESGFRQWPVGRYLLRMARSPNAPTRAIVIDAIRSLAATKHPDVRLSAMEIVAALPADEAALLADVVAGWLDPDADMFMQFPPVIIANLARGGQPAAGLLVARALFQVFWRNGQVATLFDQFMYEHFLPDAAKALADVAAIPTIDLFCKILREVAVLQGRLGDVGSDDFSYYLVTDLGGNPAHRDVPAALAGAIIDAAAEAIRKDPSQTADVVASIRFHGGKLFERIAMQIVATSPNDASEIAYSYLSDESIIDADWCRDEYAAVANTWFPTAPRSVRTRILEYIDALPGGHYDAWQNWFLQNRGRPPTPDDAREYRFSTVRDVVWGWRDVLPDARRREIEAGAAEFGGRDAWKNRFFQEAQSPLTSAAMRLQPIDDTIAFLRAWSPNIGDENRSRTTSALANELRTSVSNDPMAYSLKAEQFAELQPVFLRRFLEAMHQPAANGVPLAWGNLLELMTIMCRKAQPSAPETAASDTDRYWTLKAMIDLLAAALRRNTEGIEFGHASAVRALVMEFHSLARQVAEPEGSEDRSQSHPFHRAQQTARGAALELCILLLRWLSRDETSEIGRTPRNALANAPDIRSVLDSEVSDRSKAGLTSRAIIGRYFRLMFFLGEEWLRASLPSLLPAEDEPLRTATWLSHLENDGGPAVGLIDVMAPCYAEEIDRMSERDVSDRDARNHRLADYLMVLFVDDALPEPLLRRFLDNAPASARQHAIRFIGQQIGAPLQGRSASKRIRAQSYWAQRLAAAQASDNPDQFRAEIGSIGLWVLWNVDPDWLMEQLLAIMAAGFAPNDIYSVVDKLSKLDSEKIDRVIEVLSALVSSPRVSRLTLMVQPGPMRTMLVAGKASAMPQTRSLVANIINILASKGDDSYMDLLDESG
jgi:hypothetical protein